jgi:hypothetical protein
MERISSKFQLKPSRRKQTNERKEEASEGREWRKQLLFFTSKKNKMREGLTHLIAERQERKLPRQIKCEWKWIALCRVLKKIEPSRLKKARQKLILSNRTNWI